MNNKKKYSIATHLVHSRLEMIRADLVIPSDPRVCDLSHVDFNIAFENRWLFILVCESIERDYGITPTREEYVNAARLLYNASTSSPRPESDRYRLIEFGESGWMPIKEYSGTQLPAEMTFREACHHYSFACTGKQGLVKIEKVVDPNVLPGMKRK